MSFHGGTDAAPAMEHALEMLQSESFRRADVLVISDFVMPELDGIAFLLEIRRLYPESILVLLTGYADKENAIRAINEVGIFHYAEKPWDNEDLLTISSQILEMTKAIHALAANAVGRPAAGDPPGGS